MLGHAFVQWLFCFPNVEVFAFLIALDSIHQIAFVGLWCFGLRMYQSLTESVGGFEIHGDTVFVKDPPEFFWHARHIWDHSVVSLVLSFLLNHFAVTLSGSRCSFHKCPPGVTAGFESISQVFVFCPLGL